MTTLDTIEFMVFGNEYTFHLPLNDVLKKLLAFERSHLGKVEFEMFSEVMHCHGVKGTYMFMVHTKEGFL